MTAGREGGVLGRWIPELDTQDYPEPIVDHRAERGEALRRYEAAKRA